MATIHPTDTRRVCGHCGAAFDAKPWQVRTNARFCSRACANRSRGTGVERACETCGTLFRAKPAVVKVGWGRFCSSRCKYAGRPLDRRFLRYVGPPEPNGCILWTGALMREGGYGTIGRGGTHGGMVGAHRYAWERANGPVPPGLCVLHRCDTPRCLNVDQLFLGTDEENHLDKMAKGRQAKGERVHGAKLNEEAVRAMRQLHAAGRSINSLAREFRVSEPAAAAVVHRKTWRHVATR